jgi:hypothetical protein
MKNFYPGIFVAIVAAIALFSSSCGSRNPQPVYNGKSLSEWLGDMKVGNPKEVTEPAEQAIRQIGTNALPFLLKEISDLGDLWQKVGPTNFAREGQTRLYNVRIAFKTLGPIAKPAVPALVDLLNKGNDSDCAAVALTQVDPQFAVIALTDALTNKLIAPRIAAADALFYVRSNADIAVPNLIQCLKYKPASQDLPQDVIMLKGFTADMLGVIHARSDITVPALIEALDDKEPQVRFESLRALGKFGPAAVAAVPALQQATNDPELGIREVATFSLKQIQLPAP